MTQDEIIDMARQAGFEEQFTRPQDAIVRKGFALSGEFKGYKANNAALEAFAKLVAAKEREACARKTGEFSQKWWSIHCASNLHYSSTLKAHRDFCALQAAIRARGEA